MEITYDKQADAMYIYFQKGKKPARTVELADLLIADLDRSGRIIGVEILDASRQMKKSHSQIKSKKGGILNFSLPVPA